MLLLFVYIQVEGRGMDEAKCRGQVVGASDDICQPGEAKVAISFSEAGRDVCGTTMSLYDVRIHYRVDNKYEIYVGRVKIILFA